MSLFTIFYKSFYTNVSLIPRKTNFPTTSWHIFPCILRHLHGQEPVRVFLLSEPFEKVRKNPTIVDSGSVVMAWAEKIPFN